MDHIKNRVKFTELEASFVIRDLALALQFLHKKGNLLLKTLLILGKGTGTLGINQNNYKLESK